ncbi:MAG TPA: hypothetical protein VKQ05_14770 [Gemmatimonadales bacterium]|nr:hypothetical protein [Gemmatimonadales bacterium]
MRALAVSLVAALACNPFAFWTNATTQRDAAQQATERFHLQLDLSQFDSIYQQADPEFRNAGSEKDANGLWRMVQRRFGTLQSDTLLTWNVSFTTSNGTVVRLVYRTTFAIDKATETFTWRIRDGKPALLGYNINSPALLRAMVDEKN